LVDAAAVGRQGGSDMTTPAVELCGVTKRFGKVAALREVDLTVETGEFLTLLGPSGCGKTTLLRLIGGFDTPDTGSISLDGKDVTKTPPHRRSVNTVFQSYALFPHLTVWENIAFGLKMQGAARQDILARVGEALQLVALTGLDARKPHQLSGGQRQRVALARALVCRPRVLLLDEPLAALDAKLRHAMQLELKALQRKVGLTFIFVTHDQQEALAMSDRIALLNEGRIEQMGPAHEIYTRPRTAFVADFIGRANLLRAAISHSEGRMRCVDSAGAQWQLDPAEQDTMKPGPVDLVIRPERIALASSAGGLPNEFSATVRSAVFRGAATEVALSVAGGAMLYVLTGSPPAAGAQVWCSVQPRDIVLLR
jgi:spermidine/putrescine transport system ATP-binding protein